MIYDLPSPNDEIDQGDLIDGCPVLRVSEFLNDRPEEATYDVTRNRIIVLTQTCDLAQRKSRDIVVASVFAAHDLVTSQVLKPADIRGPLRGGRVWGYYFLPADDKLGLNEMIVDLRRLTTVRVEVLREISRSGKRQARLRSLYREHLARHFAETYARIGLPRPIESL